MREPTILKMFPGTVLSDETLTCAWFAELAELRERAERCQAVRATIADFRNLQITGRMIKEETKYARQQLREAVVHQK